MDLAEMGELVLRPKLQRAGAAGMKPGRRFRDDLQALDRRARGLKHGKRVSLGVERVHWAGSIGPMAPGAGATADTRHT